MNDLIEYIDQHALTGPAKDGEADVIFFGVTAINGATKEDLRAAIIKAGIKGAFATVDLFDGQEHTYIEIGGWIGDQGFALKLIGLGAAVGLWELLTPRTVLGDIPQMTDELANHMAGMGYVSLQYKQEHATEHSS
jgi:hypothetical protein